MFLKNYSEIREFSDIQKLGEFIINIRPQRKKYSVGKRKMIVVRGSQVQEDMKSNVKVNMWISLNEYIFFYQKLTWIY